MKEFNLDAAIRGEKLITRDKREVTEFHFFKTAKSCRYIAVIDGSVLSFNADGRYWDGDVIDERDLFMAPTTNTYYVNLYFNESYGCAVGRTHKTEQSAKMAIQKDGQNELRSYLKTIEFEVEECNLI